MPGRKPPRAQWVFPFFSALVLSSLWAVPILADTITLKNGKDLKGLVVEQHADRIIVSTVEGEIPIPLKGIKNIQYDSPEQNFMKTGRAFEQAGRLGEALAYYEKAHEINPDFGAAQAAADAVRNRFWAVSTEGPRGEVEQKQLLYDAWQNPNPAGLTPLQKGQADARTLHARLGIMLDKDKDWSVISAVDPKKPAAVAGLKRFDRLTAVDAESLRYLSVEVVRKKLLEPRYTNFRLTFARELYLHGSVPRTPRELGFELILGYDGLKVRTVKAGSEAERAGLKEQDLVTHVDGQATRYLPQDKVEKMIRASVADRTVLTVQRAALLVRG